MAGNALHKIIPGMVPTTGIGSLPHADVSEACEFVLKSCLGIPFWPQLPRRDPLEQMIPQFSEGMPCVRVREDGNGVCWDRSVDKYAELGPFYESFLSGESGSFAISADRAPGFEAFLKAAEGETWSVVKGQVTGPITFSTGIRDGDDLYVYADADLRDCAVKLISRKAEWQIARLNRLSTERVLIFVDEPVLAAYGSSAYLGILEEDVREMEGEVFSAIEQAGGISGIHVCGNSDWGMVIRTGVQVVNFDAYQYGETLALYAADVVDLLDRGGSIAWGIVPTGDAVHGEDADSLAQRFENCVSRLSERGVPEEQIREQSLLTPSCGAGTLTVSTAERVFMLLGELRQIL